MGKIETIPKNMSIKTLPDGSVVMQERRRSRRRYKMPKAQRDAIRKARKKMKLPVVQGVLIAAPIVDAGAHAMKFEGRERIREAGRKLIFNYSGYDISVKKWAPGQAWGAFTTAGWFVAKKAGVFKAINQFLGQNKVPLLRA